MFSHECHPVPSLSAPARGFPCYEPRAGRQASRPPRLRLVGYGIGRRADGMPIDTPEGEAHFWLPMSALMSRLTLAGHCAHDGLGCKIGERLLFRAHAIIAISPGAQHGDECGYRVHDIIATPETQSTTLFILTDARTATAHRRRKQLYRVST